MRGATYQSNPALRGAQTGNQGTTLNNRLSQQTQNQNTTKPEPKPIVGTNYIKCNIANFAILRNVVAHVCIDWILDQQ